MGGVDRTDDECQLENVMPNICSIVDIDHMREKSSCSSNQQTSMMMEVWRYLRIDGHMARNQAMKAR